MRIKEFNILNRSFVLTRKRETLYPNGQLCKKMANGAISAMPVRITNRSGQALPHSRVLTADYA